MSERLRVALVCSECGRRNYQTTRAKRTGPEKRLELKKFCPGCGKHTTHRESK